MIPQNLRDDIRNSEGKILIVGGRTTNFPIEARDNDRIIFWDSTHYDKASRINFIPKGVKWIFITRWVSHSTLARIKNLMEPGTVFLNVAQSTGEIRKLIDIMKPEDIIHAKKDELQKGEMSLLRWVSDNVDYENRSVKDQAKKLLTTAQILFPKITFERLRDEIYRVKYLRNKKLGTVKKRKEREVKSPAPIVEEKKSAIGILQEFKNHLKSAKEAIEILELDCEQIELEFRSMQIQIKKSGLGIK